MAVIEMEQVHVDAIRWEQTGKQGLFLTADTFSLASFLILSKGPARAGPELLDDAIGRKL